MILSRVFSRYSCSNFGVIAGESTEYRRVFCDRMADIAIFSEINPIDSSWLFRFVQTVSIQDRLSWVHAAKNSIEGLDDQAKVVTWARWLKTYWERRNGGVPLQYEDVEAEEMAELTFALEPVMDEAVELLCMGPKPDLKRSMIYYSLNETGLATRKPETTTRLLLFLLNSEVDRPIHDMDKLEGAVCQLIAAKAPKVKLVAIRRFGAVGLLRSCAASEGIGPNARAVANPHTVAVPGNAQLNIKIGKSAKVRRLYGSNGQEPGRFVRDLASSRLRPRVHPISAEV